ncbi:hypothetical protein AVEN_115784-1 [Araneus ventricosus]|uniref:Uncharacterized protein n=1 Tax=Araneus ventricosus TaxID=182803 RepID=A0A4Y2MPA6_ARAVE|nr:hypothetical protein AVEN_115784-1 [Araneus ventricosus]
MIAVGYSAHTPLRAEVSLMTYRTFLLSTFLSNRKDVGQDISDTFSLRQIRVKCPIAINVLQAANGFFGIFASNDLSDINGTCAAGLIMVLLGLFVEDRSTSIIGWGSRQSQC